MNPDGEGIAGVVEPVTVGVIHVNQVSRHGMVDLLSRYPDVRVAGQFDSAAQVLERPIPGRHVLLYDLRTSKQDGAELMKRLLDDLPQAQVLVFGVEDDDAAIIDCIQAGASGCIIQDASADDIREALQSLAQGDPPVSPRVVTTLFKYVASLRDASDPVLASQLTPREEQILQLMAEGLANKEIAERLSLRPQTVKNYVHQVLQKLNLRSRLDVIRLLRKKKSS